MPLRQTNLVEISDLRVLCFRSVFRFLVLFFTPSLIHTSSPHPGPNATFCTPKMTSKQKTTGTNSELSLNLNGSFSGSFIICQTKRPNFGCKSQGSPFFGPFSGYHFLRRIFLPSASGASRKRLAGGTPSRSPRPHRHPRGGPARRRPGHAAHPPRGAGARARERRRGWRPQRLRLNCGFAGGVVGVLCQKKYINPIFSSLV